MSTFWKIVYWISYVAILGFMAWAMYSANWPQAIFWSLLLRLPVTLPAKKEDNNG